MDTIIFILSAICILVALIGLFAGFSSLRFISLYKMQNFETVNGVIEEFVEIKHGKKVFQHPVLNFFYNETEYHVQSGLTIPSTEKVMPPSGKPFEVGDKVEVRIYRNDVSTAILDAQYILDRIKAETHSMLVFSAIALIVGVILTIFF